MTPLSAGYNSEMEDFKSKVWPLANNRFMALSQIDESVDIVVVPPHVFVIYQPFDLFLVKGETKMLKAPAAEFSRPMKVQLFQRYWRFNYTHYAEYRTPLF